MRPLWGVMAVAFAIAAVVWVLQTGRSLLAPVGALAGAWLVFGAGVDLWMKTGRGDLNSKIGRTLRLPRADLGRVVAHAGFGVTIFGIAAMMAWEIEDIRVAEVGGSFDVGRYTVELRAVEDVQGPNYLSTMAEMAVSKDGKVEAVLFPEKRIYPVAAMPTTEAAIDNGVFRDLYLVIGDPQEGGGWAVRTYIKPFASWIWAGAIIMALGGTLSLADRRFRVGAGARKAPAGVPAE